MDFLSSWFDGIGIKDRRFKANQRVLLSKAFKADRKEGFSEYVTSLRMKRAYELIVEFDTPPKDVGAMVGYFDLAHFYKTFKKHFGKTPGEVRESLKKDKTTTP